MKTRIGLYIIMVFMLGAVLNSCSIKYSFSGTNLSPEIKTYSVYYFNNRARLVNPTLSQTFTEELKDKLRRQTSLKEAAENGDLIFEGYFDNYEVRPMSIQKDDAAAQNRLTISVKVKYTNSKDPDVNFEKSFSAFEDFDSTQSLSDVEDSLVPDIIDKLLEDIFNATIANW